MTLGGSRKFFKDRLKSLQYKEWPDGFNSANIPATIIDGSYHLAFGQTRIAMIASNGGYEFVMPVTLKVLSKGFKDPSAAIDKALDVAQNILDDIIPAARALTQEGIKSVMPTGLDTQPLQISNDNAVILMMTFNMNFILRF